MKFRELDLPDVLRDALEAQGFIEMYPPQAEAIPKALTGRNLVAAVPTASGKSMVGFVPALNMILRRGSRVLYIVPLKALAAEKRDDLKKFAALGLNVVMTTGDPDRDDDVSNADIVIATSEKADSMIRHGNPWVQRLGLVIADEIHMIHDPDRGPTLEVALTKLMRRNPGMQVIALSATISNAEDLAQWLDANLVRSDWRPTKLKEGVYFNGEITFADASDQKVPPAGRDEIWSLVKQTTEEGGQCLVFVNARRSTEAVAAKLAGKMKALGDGPLSAADQALLEGGSESTGIGRKLAACVATGVAFHHAGLDYQQRRCVEDGFRARRIKCIVATPTLAAGINLPARRVLVRDTTRFESNAGNVPISVMEVKQMCGRAGRPGYDPWGEAVLIAKSYEDYEHLMDDYVMQDTERLTSKLGSEKTLRSHILGLLATGDADSEGDIADFLGATFFGATNQMYGIERVIENVVDFLCEQEMAERIGDRVHILPFGKRVSDLYVDPWSAVILRKAVLKLKPNTDLFLILHAIAATPDLMGLYPKKSDEACLDATDGEYDGRYLCTEIDEGGGESDESIDWDNHRSNLKTALLLRDWIDERSEDTITGEMKIGPGDIRARVDAADWILYAMNEVAYLFNPDACRIIKPLLTRVRYGVREELIPLVAFRGVARTRARVLFNAGIRGRQDIATTDEKQLAALPKIGPALARSLKEQAGYQPLPDAEKPFPPEDDEEAVYDLERMAVEAGEAPAVSDEKKKKTDPGESPKGQARIVDF